MALWNILEKTVAIHAVTASNQTLASLMVRMTFSFYQRTWLLKYAKGFKIQVPYILEILIISSSSRHVGSFVAM